MMKKFIAECLGTAVLVTFGCGVAATNGLGAGYVGIALAFGLVIIAMAYSVGNISGCHVNPAVSLAMLINKKLTPTEFVGYVVSQFIGAILGGFILYAMLAGTPFLAENGMGTNGYGDLSATGITLFGAIIAEIVLTFVFVFAICGVTSKPEFSKPAGLAYLDVKAKDFEVIYIQHVPFGKYHSILYYWDEPQELPTTSE